MSDFIDLPMGLHNLRPRTFVLIEANWLSVRDYFVSLWPAAAKEEWLIWSELPCRLNLRSAGLYQGQVQLGVLRPTLKKLEMCTCWTTEADSAGPFLYKLAHRIRCRIISATFCYDWSNDNALAQFVVYDGRVIYCERLVRVMRGDGESGRLEYFECGSATEFEPEGGFRRGLLKKRLSEDVLQRIWRRMGIDLGEELSLGQGREGIVYIQARNGPLSPGEAFSRTL